MSFNPHPHPFDDDDDDDDNGSKRDDIVPDNYLNHVDCRTNIDTTAVVVKDNDNYDVNQDDDDSNVEEQKQREGDYNREINDDDDDIKSLHLQFLLEPRPAHTTSNNVENI